MRKMNLKERLVPTFTRIDKAWVDGKRMSYRDEGPAVMGGKTKKFSVYSRTNRSLLGYIQWFGTHYGYSFFPLNNVFDIEQLTEVAEFCYNVTKAHKERLEANKPKQKYLKLSIKENKFERTVSRKELIKRGKIVQSKNGMERGKIVQSKNGLVEEANKDCGDPKYVQGE